MNHSLIGKNTYWWPTGWGPTDLTPRIWDTTIHLPIEAHGLGGPNPGAHGLGAHGSRATDLGPVNPLTYPDKNYTLTQNDPKQRISMVTHGARDRCPQKGCLSRTLCFVTRWLGPDRFGLDRFGTRLIWIRLIWDPMDLDPMDLDPMDLGPDGFGPDGFGARLIWDSIDLGPD